jgi:hypothetical protein
MRIHLHDGSRLDLWSRQDGGAGIAMEGDETASRHLSRDEVERLWRALDEILHPHRRRDERR